jgi:hypothetical protein
VRTPYGYIRRLTPHSDISAIDTVRLHAGGDHASDNRPSSSSPGARTSQGLGPQPGVFGPQRRCFAKWLSEFERGRTTAVELPLVLRVLAALDLVVDISTIQHSAADLPAVSDHDRGLDLDEVLSDYATRDQR